MDSLSILGFSDWGTDRTRSLVAGTKEWLQALQDERPGELLRPSKPSASS